MQPLRLHDVPFELVPHEVGLLLIATPAGFPSPAADDLEEPIDLGNLLIEHPAASYVMRVAGEAMTGAEINDGHFIVVSRSVAPTPGHIVVALVHGDHALKRLRKMDGRLRLVSEADGYPTMIVDEHVEVWGVVWERCLIGQAMPFRRV